MNAHCPFGPLETMTILRTSESSLGRFWCETSFRFISIFIASFFFISLVVCKLFANRCTILRGVFTIFRLIKKTGQDNSYMHLSGANFWHLIFRPNFKVVDIINDIFRNGRNTQIWLLQISGANFGLITSPQRLLLGPSLSPPEL